MIHCKSNFGLAAVPTVRQAKSRVPLLSLDRYYAANTRHHIERDARSWNGRASLLLV
jgi:hypothetical protein